MPGSARTRRRAIRSADVTQGAVTLAVLMLLAEMMAPIAFCPVSRAGSEWTLTSLDDFNVTGSEFLGTIINETGPQAAIMLERTGHWSRGSSTIALSWRTGCQMAAIGGHGELLLFGGRTGGYLNDTWVYDPVTDRWSQRFPASSPSPRRSAMASVCGDDRVVLFGGALSDSRPQSISNETWIYDLSENQWHNVTPVTSPPVRANHAMAPIWNTDKAIIFGGFEDYPYYFNDTWLYDAGDGTWTRFAAMPGPPARYGHVMAMVPGDDKVVLFGGIASDGYMSDTWVFDLSEGKWTRKNPPDQPQARGSAMMSPSYQANESIILFGGENNDVPISDTWSYNCTDDCWRHISQWSSPGPLKDAGMDSVPSSGKVVLFGGDKGFHNYDPSNATWIFDASEYNSIGEYISAPFDTGGPSAFRSVSWNATLPAGTSVELQLRTSETASNLSSKSYSGPNGTNSKWYTNGSLIWEGHQGDRWVQYRARLRTENLYLSPVLEDVSIFYDRLPGPPVLEWPQDAGWFSTGSHPFNWSLNDSDSSAQDGFEWQLNQYPDESSNLYATGGVFSSGTNFTPTFQIPAGIWYWRVRTLTEGEWGPFSQFRKIGVEYSPPAPFTVTARPSSWTNGPVEISYSTSDNFSGLDKYQLWVDGEPYGDQASPFIFQNLVDGVHEVRVRAYDRAGNYAQSRVNVYIDITRPEPFRPAALSAWSRNDPQISFDAEDAWSGVDHYEVSADSGPFETEGSPFTLYGLTEGLHEVVVRAVDRAGNQRDENVTAGYDIGDPHIRLFSVLPSGWTNEDPTVTFDAQDDLSGIDHFEISLDNGPFSACVSPLALAGLAEGRHGIMLRALDRAGNRAEQNLQVQIDRTPPEAFTPLAQPGNWTSQDPVLSFETVDALSGVDGYEVLVDGGEPVVMQSPTILEGLREGAHQVTVRARDKAGNHQDGNVSVYIDRSPPVSVTVLFLNVEDVASSRNIVLSIAAADNISGLDKMCFSNDGIIYTQWEPFNHAKKWTLSPDNGRKTVYLKVKDRAGNEAPAAHAMISLNDLTSSGFFGALALAGAIAALIIAGVAMYVWLRMRGRMRKDGRVDR
jgi:N-acetylneuraminic acid mutarotase